MGPDPEGYPAISSFCPLLSRHPSSAAGAAPAPRHERRKGRSVPRPMADGRAEATCVGKGSAWRARTYPIPARHVILARPLLQDEDGTVRTIRTVADIDRRGVTAAPA